jgi:Holliday junction resolvase/endogenous inhibitor of DNA gyrase (YacG/DUF329 family)
MSKVFGLWHCQQCGIAKTATVHQKRKKYCSNKCVSIAYKSRMLGENNGNYSNAGNKICKVCEIKFKHYSKTRQYCSLKCRDVEGNEALRHNARKDANHNEIVEILEKGGVVVRDTSKLMRGFPDLLAWHMDQWHLIEIKNPNTAYGKKGLSRLQQEFATTWKGGPVFIMRTAEDANKFIIGEFSEIDKIGGNG